MLTDRLFESHDDGSARSFRPVPCTCRTSSFRIRAGWAVPNDRPQVRRPSCRFCSSIELGHPQNQLRTPELNHGQLPFFRGTVQRNRKGGECLSRRWLAAELAERPRPTPSTPEAGAGSPPKDSLEVRSPAPASSTARKSEGECRSRLFVRGDRNFAAVGFDD